MVKEEKEKKKSVTIIMVITPLRLHFKELIYIHKKKKKSGTTSAGRSASGSHVGHQTHSHD